MFECQPKIDKAYLEYADGNAESVRRLKRTSVPIPHAGGSYPAKPHFKIIAGILAIEVGWKDGFAEAFEKCYLELTGPRKLDCGLAVDGHSFDTFASGGACTHVKSENALIFFLFRLLNQLQSLGTLPAIDWNTYTSQLSK